MANDDRSCKVFNDPVHGHMEMHPLCVAIIDTPEFQRLRFLKQLGVSYYVYPGACHNRFEHSLGVCFLAGKMVKRLKETQPDLGISEEDVLCVQVAGLCHDLGHGPFSHVFDRQFMPRIKPEKKWRHEEASIAMFDFLVKNNTLKLEPLFKKYGIEQKERDFIKEMIHRPSGNTTRYKAGSKKAFLYEIVANERNGMDVDKWDYFSRDALHLGMRISFDHVRLINFCRVIKVDGQWQICVRDKEAFNVHDMFQTRFALHRRAYKHKVVQAVEMMLVDAMEEYEKFLRDHREEGTPLSECIESMEAYVNLTDFVIHDILQKAGDDPHLKKAQDILRKLQRRELYICLKESNPFTAEVAPDVINMTNSMIEDDIEGLLNGVEGAPPRSSYAIQTVRLNFGMRNENPLNNLRYYLKDNMDRGEPIEATEISAMFPKEFEECRVRLFFRPTETNNPGIPSLCAAFEEWCRRNLRPTADHSTDKRARREKNASP